MGWQHQVDGKLVYVAVHSHRRGCTPRGQFGWKVLPYKVVKMRPEFDSQGRQLYYADNGKPCFVRLGKRDQHDKFVPQPVVRVPVEHCGTGQVNMIKYSMATGKITHEYGACIDAGQKGRGIDESWSSMVVAIPALRKVYGNAVQQILDQLLQGKAECEG